jgi:hypothetical protein
MNEFDRLCENSCKLQVAITKPQLRLLLELEAKPIYVATYYSPAKALVKDGRAQWAGDNLKITATGEELLARVRAYPNL